jgi:hypothetical protein
MMAVQSPVIRDTGSTGITGSERDSQICGVMEGLLAIRGEWPPTENDTMSEKKDGPKLGSQNGFGDGKLIPAKHNPAAARPTFK